jgi:hypothetical protein
MSAEAAWNRLSYSVQLELGWKDERRNYPNTLINIETRLRRSRMCAPTMLLLETDILIGMFSKKAVS